MKLKRAGSSLIVTRRLQDEGLVTLQNLKLYWKNEGEEKIGTKKIKERERLTRRAVKH